uniref:Uncharacterized protein n=1 Tax=Arundo donax TaxID=35708 RepID=A0A0A9BM78_ARUDO
MCIMYRSGLLHCFLCILVIIYCSKCGSLHW